MSSRTVSGANAVIEAWEDSSGGYVVIGCTTSHVFRFTNELIGKTTVDSGLFRKRRVRISDMAASVQGLVITENTADRLTIFHFLQEGIRRGEIDLRFIYTDEIGNVQRITGTFLVESIELPSDFTGWAEFDMQLVGSGQPSLETVEDPGEAVCPDLFFDWWETTPGDSGISGPGTYGRDFAGMNVLEVDREGIEHDIIDSGSPGNREARYTGGAVISFDPTNPFNAGERVYVLWTDGS
jgi:hypothetical protein